MNPKHPASRSCRGSLNQFGDAVSLSGDLALVGAGGYDLYSGAAFAFSFEPCVLDVDLNKEILRGGDDLEVGIHLEHNGLQTVTAAFRVWIEAADGGRIASRTLGPRVFRHGDEVDLQLTVALPLELSPGVYRVKVGVERMQQGKAGARKAFRIVP